ncbi:MAG: SagB/ThcOx family dehydrogenase [Selenomonas sp.]|nr:SagB/ThcOx family dehydrogenase [Selenomonas sp.]
MGETYQKEQAFLEDTAAAWDPQSPLKRGEPFPAPEKQAPAEAKLVRLPEPELLPDREVNFLELVELRASVRSYTETPFTMQELSYLLWCTQGVKMPIGKGGSMRNVPSAGARHAFETYLFVQKVEGLVPGFYRYLAYEHALLPLADAIPWEESRAPFIEAFRTQHAVAESAVTFVWAAHIERLLYVFGKRGYRYAFLDAGHVCENLYLAAGTLKAGCCAMGAFEDAALNRLLHLDGVQEFSVYAATAGKTS